MNNFVFRENQFETFDRNYGVVLLKPETVERGYTQKVISKFISLLPESITIFCMQNIHFTSETDIQKIYPDMPYSDEEYQQATIEYMKSGNSVICVLENDSDMTYSFINKLKQVKGRSLAHWSVEQLETRIDTESFVRGIIPLPGMEVLFKDLIQKIIDRKKGLIDMKLTLDEKRIYVQNLVHTSDRQIEVEALLSFLSKEKLNSLNI